MKDDAVAEVVGVILIIAITVVVAAIVAAFAIGMGSSIKKPYQVYFTLERSTPSTNIIITNIGGQDLKLLTGIEISYTDASGSQLDFHDPQYIIDHSSGLANGASTCMQVADSLELDSSMVKPSGACHVVVRGNFVDGSQQVLMQGDV